MIVVDELTEYPPSMTTYKGLPGTRWSHMSSTIADPALAEAELTRMALKIGAKPAWIQHKGRPTVHYDLTPSMRTKALTAGAVEVDAMDFARARREGQAAVEQLVQPVRIRPVFGLTEPPMVPLQGGRGCLNGGSRTLNRNPAPTAVGIPLAPAPAPTTTTPARVTCDLCLGWSIAMIEIPDHSGQIIKTRTCRVHYHGLAAKDRAQAEERANR